MTTTRILVAASLLALAIPAFASSGDAEAGKKKSVPCQACHGQNGVSVSPEFPILAGQNAEYLAKVLSHYKNGKRKNPIMTAQVANLTPKDMEDLAAFFGSQPGGVVQKY